MVTLELNSLEIFYFSMFIVIILGAIILGYALTPNKYKNFNLNLILLLALLGSMLIVPERYLIFLLVVVILVLLNILVITFAPKFFQRDQNRLLVDKPPQVWEQYSKAPELKEDQK
jgi:hypothetical protein